MGANRIKVMVVDDSRVARLLLEKIFRKAGLEVVASLSNAAEALQHLDETGPDVVVMDVEMPGMNGIEATRTIMETRPLPIVIASNVLSSTDAEHNFMCLEAGALALVEKPVGPAHPGYEKIQRNIVRTVQAMAEVKVIRRWPARVKRAPRGEVAVPEIHPQDVKVIAIGASTGGPNAIRTILEGLPKDFPFPILIVQHMSEGFVGGFASWLTASTGFPVSVAEEGALLLPGRALVAPDGFHMGLSRGLKVALAQSPAENGARPSVSYLFRSVASRVGADAVGVLLTGMGTDGASGLLDLKQAGAATITEDKSTAVVYGMPGAAVELGAADFVLTPRQISQTLSSLTTSQNG